MKNIILVLFILISSHNISQTKLDTMVFNKLNIYRDSLKINNIEFSNHNYIISNKHAINYSKNGTITKSNDIQTFEIGSYLLIILSVDCKNVDEIISNFIITEWINSTDHNKIIKNNNYKIVGISSIVKMNKKVLYKNKICFLYEIYSIMNFK